jgi:hypothetical protein
MTRRNVEILTLVVLSAALAVIGAVYLWQAFIR